MTVGVNVTATEVPPATTSLYNTQNAFLVGFTDWGPVGQPVRVTSLANAASQLGTPTGSSNPYAARTTTNSVVFDAIDTLLQEDGTASPTVYVSRVVHGTPTSATLALAPSAALTVTAAYPGSGGNGIFVAVTNNTTNVVLTLTDSAGNTLATSPQLANLAACVAWAATTGLITAVSTGSSLPSTVAATALSGGADNHASAVLSDWQTALSAFSPTLGPGQVIAPGQTNTNLSGIWSALGTHAASNNRVAICGMDDNVSATTEVTDLSTFGTSAVASYCGFWAGNRNLPGITPGTSRSVSPGPVIAGLCARADAATGNPNVAAAGVNYPLSYATSATSLVSGSPLDTYSNADLQTLNAAGINTFQTVDGLPCNYGFVTPELSTSDAIYWQFNHSRLRMYIVAQAQLIGQPFVFAQIDGQQSVQNQFKGALQAMLQNLFNAGALWSASGLASDSFNVDTGPDVNTPATIAAGQLNAVITCSFSYFAQSVNIQINVVPITQAL
jgi:hypothetical protein